MQYTLLPVILRGLQASKNPQGACAKKRTKHILTSNSGTLYTGITNSIFHRVLQHKKK